MNREKAIEIFVKYNLKYFTNYHYESEGNHILSYAWYSQFWCDEKTMRLYPGNPKKYDWVNDEFMEAANWYVKQVINNNGRISEKAESIAKEIGEKVYAIYSEKRKKQEISRKKREDKLEAQGEEFKSNMKIGEVYMMEFKRILHRERGILVLEIEDSFLAGFYLDRDDKKVPISAPEKKGYVYSKPFFGWDGKKNKEMKFEWDGKTFKKTRTYESKLYKFVKRRIDNPVIIKSF